MTSWMESATARKVSWALVAVFLWTFVCEQPVHAVVEVCKGLREAALPQSRDLTDSEMAAVVGGLGAAAWDGPPGGEGSGDGNNPQGDCDNAPGPGTGACGAGGPAGAAGGGAGGGGGGGDGGGGNGGAMTAQSAGCPSCGRGAGTGRQSAAISHQYGTLTMSAPVGKFSSGKGSLSIEMYHNSLDSYSGPLGAARNHTFNVILTSKPSEFEDADVRIMAPDGTRLDFMGDGDWKTEQDATFTPMANVWCELVKENNVFKLKACGSPSLREKGDVLYIFGEMTNNVAKLVKRIVENGGSAEDDYVTSLGYDGSGNIEYAVDGAGNRATFVYDDVTSHIEYVKYPGDVRTTFYYTDDDLTTVVYPTDPGENGATVGYSYDSDNNISAITGGGGTTTYEYYQARIRVIEDPLGYTTTYDWKTYGGRVVEMHRTAPSGAVDTVENNWDEALPVCIKDAAGNRTTYAYNADNRVTTVSYKIDGQLCTKEQEYDAYGHITKIKYSPANTSVVYTYYEGTNDVESVTNELDETTTYTYDNHRIASIEDPLSNFRTYVYATTITLPIEVWVTREGEASTITYTYYASGAGAGKVESIKDDLDNFTTYTYDFMGRLKSVTVSPSSGVDYTTTYSYDDWDRKTKVTHPGSTSVVYDYSCCYLTQVTDENGNATQFDYHDDGSLKVTTDPAGQATETSFGYVTSDSWRTVKNAEGKTTTYTYDLRNLLKKIEYADGTSELFTYEESRRIRTRVDALGSTTTYDYDNRGRLTKIDYPNDTDVLFSYDDAGRRTGMSDGSGGTSYEYYANGRLKKTSVTFSGEAWTKIVTYDYYADGSRKTLTYPGVSTVTYHYDNAGRLFWLENTEGEKTTYTYDGLGRITKRELGNGAYTSYDYNNRSWITDVRNIKRDGSTVVSSFSYYYVDGGDSDNAGNILKIVQRLSDGETYTSTYRYDSVYRLTSEGRTGPSAYRHTYGYDNVGNRETLSVEGGGITTYEYDLYSNSQLETESSGDTTITYGYDSRGNTLTKAVSGGGTTSYTYDDNNKLTKIEYPSGSTSSEYKYNGGSLRVKKAASDGTETYFIYDGSSVITEVDTNGDAQATYTYGPNGLISQKLGSTSYYVGCDHLGSVWDLVTLDEDENVDVSYTYTAFGNTDRSVRQGATDPNDAYRYVGALGYYADADDNHGLLFTGARYYNPSNARLMTQSNSANARFAAADESPNWIPIRQPPNRIPDKLGEILGEIFVPLPFPTGTTGVMHSGTWGEGTYSVGVGVYPASALYLGWQSGPPPPPPPPRKWPPDPVPPRPIPEPEPSCPEGWTCFTCPDGVVIQYPPGTEVPADPCAGHDKPKPPPCPKQ